MGQAKLKGTFEERQEAAIAKREAFEEEYEKRLIEQAKEKRRKEQEHIETLSEEDRTKYLFSSRRRGKSRLALMTAIAAGMASASLR